MTVGIITAPSGGYSGCDSAVRADVAVDIKESGTVTWKEIVCKPQFVRMTVF